MKSTFLYPAFLRRMQRDALLPEGAWILVACSGGIDSMVLLHLLNRLKERFNWTLVVGHINYGKRGKESDEDGQLVRQFCEEYSIKLLINKEFKNYKADRSNFQDAAREYRYRCFQEWAVGDDIHYIVTAHHRDDQVETILHRLLRGAGPQGLAGMREQRVLGEGGSHPIALVRPFLPFSRADIEVYAAHEKVPYRYDQSNESLDYLRNRLRHELVPLLRSLAPEVDIRFEELGNFFESLNDFFKVEVEKFIAGAVVLKKGKKAVSFARVDFLSLAPILQRQVLYTLLQQHLPGAFVSRETIDKLCLLIVENRAPVEYSLPQGALLVKDAEHVAVLK